MEDSVIFSIILAFVAIVCVVVFFIRKKVKAYVERNVAEENFSALKKFFLIASLIPLTSAFLIFFSNFILKEQRGASYYLSIAIIIYLLFGAFQYFKGYLTCRKSEKLLKSENDETFDPDETADNPEFLEALSDFLDCEVIKVDPNTTKQGKLDLYLKSLREGREKGFIPVYLYLDEDDLDFFLDEINNLDETNDDFVAPTKEEIKAFRDEIISSEPDKFSKTFNDQLELLEDEYDWESLANDSTDDKFFPINRLDSIDACHNNLLLAKIPVENAWDVFAYIPFRCFAGLSEYTDLRSAAKHWKLEYGAMPCAITSNTLMFYVPKPVSPTKSEKLAYEHFVMCDSLTQLTTTIKNHASLLEKSSFWFFWWE